MTRSMLGRTAFAGLVAVALGFGAREAAAAPETAREERPYCVDDADCQAICEQMYPGKEVFGVCSLGHTCYCYM